MAGKMPAPPGNLVGGWLRVAMCSNTKERPVLGIEIEAKMRLDDVAQLEARLTDAGATLTPLITEVNSYFDTPQGTLRGSDQGLRIRVERHEGNPQPTIIITHKGPRAHGDLKSRSETELQVTDAQVATDLLVGIRVLCLDLVLRSGDGVGVSTTATSTSISFRTLGHFVEIEGPSEDAVLAVRRDLALDGLPMLRGSYVAMLDAYLAEHHITDKHIKLGDSTGWS